jgi:D-glycero-beta-D-manno-heptose-7-phosphate kinase
MQTMPSIQQLENQRIVIVGDVMLDRYLTGSVSRISPEAPVPVVRHRRTEDRLGGAANVVLNIRAMGSHPILCSVVGDDADGALLEQILPQHGVVAQGLVRSATRSTTVKTRVLAQNQQMLRIDHEDTHDLTEQETADLLTRLRHLLDEARPDALILQDYNKGVLTPTVIESVLAECQTRNIPTAVDPKRNNFFLYRGVTLFKPNLKEIRDSVPFDVQPTTISLQRAADFMRAQLGHHWTMITLSERGLFLDTGSGGQVYPTIERNVADVSGAGDTVISVATLGMAAGWPPEAIARLSNLAGGQVCEFVGVVSVQPDLLTTEMRM